MLSTPHLLTGAAIGVAAAPLGIPAVFCLAIISHLALDVVPHTDYELLDDHNSERIMPVDFPLVTLEILVGILFVLILSFYAGVEIKYLLWGAFGGFILDLLDKLPVLGIKMRKWPITKQIHDFHAQIHYDSHGKRKLLGIITQFVVIIVAVVVILKG